jgi:hypothetical protein
MILDVREFIRRLPDPCAAQELPPHPSLRPARQRPPRRQHCPHPQVARHACPSQAIRAHQLHRARRATRTTASLPLLRRSDDRHRNLRAWLRAKEPHQPNATDNQDRQPHESCPTRPSHDRPYNSPVIDRRRPFDQRQLRSRQSPIAVCETPSSRLADPDRYHRSRPTAAFIVAEDQHQHAARATIPIALGSYRRRPHLPRFRALARLGRRPTERLVRSIAEASENAAHQGPFQIDCLTF